MPVLFLYQSEFSCYLSLVNVKCHCWHLTLTVVSDWLTCVLQAVLVFSLPLYNRRLCSLLLSLSSLLRAYEFMNFVHTCCPIPYLFLCKTLAFVLCFIHFLYTVSWSSYILFTSPLLFVSLSISETLFCTCETAKHCVSTTSPLLRLM